MGSYEIEKKRKPENIQFSFRGHLNVSISEQAYS